MAGLLVVVARMAAGPPGDPATSGSFLAVMALTLAIGVALWRLFGFGPPLVSADVWFAFVGLGIGQGGGSTADGDAGLRAVVSLLWVVGGVVGVVAVWRSTRLRGDPRDSIDSTAY